MSNFEQQVPSLNTCLSLLARGITMNTIFCWARVCGEGPGRVR